MFVTFVALAVLSLLALIGGGAWALAAYGKTTTRRGPEVGAELKQEQMESESAWQGRQSVAGGAAFAGKGWAVEREAEISWVELKQTLRSGGLYRALPFLLGAAGFVGLLLFGGLALLVRLPNKLWGLAILAVLLYTLWLVYRGWRDA